MRILYSVCSFLVFTQVNAQTADLSRAYNLTNTQAIKNIPQSAKPVHKVLILGSPHFDLGNNASDWKPKGEIDMLSKKKQQEIEEMLQLLKRYMPTKICIEWLPKQDSLFQKRYRNYLLEDLLPGPGEYYQVGFRLAKMMGHGKLYCIDNKPKQPESVIDIEDWDRYVADSTAGSELEKYNSLNEKFNKYLDTAKYQMSLKDYYVFVNSDEVKQENKRLWFTGLVHVGNKSTYAGADLTGSWYQRNTRIFSNVKKLCTEPEERILIIYGYSHAFVLEEIFKASQQFEVVPVSSVLK